MRPYSPETRSRIDLFQSMAARPSVPVSPKTRLNVLYGSTPGGIGCLGPENVMALAGCGWPPTEMPVDQPADTSRLLKRRSVETLSAITWSTEGPLAKLALPPLVLR